jgi:hypothetical protein
VLSGLARECGLSILGGFESLRCIEGAAGIELVSHRSVESGRKAGLGCRVSRI